MGKRKTNKRVTVNLRPWEFNPTTLRGLNIKDLKTLYSAKRDIAQKRLKRLSNSEFKENSLVREYRDGIPTLKQIHAESDGDPEFEKNILTYELANLNVWLENEYTKVGKLKEVKAKTLQTLKEHGYDWVNQYNYMDFVEFENYLRATGLDRLYDSDQLRASDEEDERPGTETLKRMFRTYLKHGRKLPEKYYLGR